MTAIFDCLEEGCSVDAPLGGMEKSEDSVFSFSLGVVSMPYECHIFI